MGFITISFKCTGQESISVRYAIILSYWIVYWAKWPIRMQVLVGKWEQEVVFRRVRYVRIYDESGPLESGSRGVWSGTRPAEKESRGENVSSCSWRTSAFSPFKFLQMLTLRDPRMTRLMGPPEAIQCALSVLPSSVCYKAVIGRLWIEL